MSIEVTQADREAAAAFYKDCAAPDYYLEDMRTGKSDDHPAVQAFALHAAPLREALEKIAGLSTTPISEKHAAVLNGKEVLRAKAIARSALSPSYPMENNNGD